MKRSEFYEKYCRIKTLSGEVISPKLSEWEKEVMDKAQEQGIEPFIYFKGRGGNKIIINPDIKGLTMPKHTHNGKVYYLTKQRIKAGILATLYGAGQTEPINSYVFKEGTSESDMFNKLIKQPCQT